MKVIKKTHDYRKLYDDMIYDWRSFLGERTPKTKALQGFSLPFHYIGKMLYFDDSTIYSYSFTVSPKSSPILNDMCVKHQYEFMVNSLKYILSNYNCNYYITFELYEDNSDIHCHGFLTFSKVADIANVKRDIRAIYKMPKLKQGQKNILCHIKPMGYDEDQQKRWIGYCYKDLTFMCKNDFTPMYRILDGMKITDTITTLKRQPRVVLKPTDEEIELAKQEAINKQEAKDRADYELYQKLKFKFEKKPLEILISQ